MASRLKFVFTPTFIFCSPICFNNCGVVFFVKIYFNFLEMTFFVRLLKYANLHRIVKELFSEKALFKELVQPIRQKRFDS